MKWSDRYATGVEHLDNQHKVLFKLADDFREALIEGRGEQVYGLLLDMLPNYARMHFSLEEACMDRYRCPVAQTTKAAHLILLQALAEFRQRYEVSGFDRVDAHNLADTLEQRLAAHICRSDVKLKEYVNEPEVMVTVQSTP